MSVENGFDKLAKPEDENNIEIRQKPKTKEERFDDDKDLVMKFSPQLIDSNVSPESIKNGEALKHIVGRIFSMVNGVEQVLEFVDKGYFDNERKKEMFGKFKECPVVEISLIENEAAREIGEEINQVINLYNEALEYRDDEDKFVEVMGSLSSRLEKVREELGRLFGGQLHKPKKS